MGPGNAGLETKVAVLETRLEEREKALAIQAKEYERRLEVLNHAHAEAIRVQGTYVPREVYESSLRELSEWRGKADIALSNLSQVATTATALDIRTKAIEDWKTAVSAGASTATTIGKVLWTPFGGAILALGGAIYLAVKGGL